MTRLLIWSAVGQFPDMRECWILVGSSRHPRTLSSPQHLVCQNFQGSCALLQDTPTTMNRSREKRWPQFYFLVSNLFHCFWLLLPFSIHRKFVWLLRVPFHLGPQTWNTDEPHMHDWRCRSWVPLSTSAAKFISRSLSVFFNSFVKWYYCNGFHYTLVHIHGRLLNLTRLALNIVSVCP